jgi:hypothetical protein
VTNFPVQNPIASQRNRTASLCRPLSMQLWGQSLLEYKAWERKRKEKRKEVARAPQAPAAAAFVQPQMVGVLIARRYSRSLNGIDPMLFPTISWARRRTHKARKRSRPIPPTP